MTITKFSTILGFILITTLPGHAQKKEFSRQDTLRGSITKERKWWDLTYYHLNVKVDPVARSFKGNNLIQYKVLEEANIMQIDLQPPMQITGVSQAGSALEFTKDGNAWFIELKDMQNEGDIKNILVEFSGHPKMSRRPPWDGGVTWTKDGSGNDFIATANQGDGASLWWPCKDHPYDEPDSMLISVTFPDTLMNVSNGRLRALIDNQDGTKTTHWFVSNPINGYGVNINIANYISFRDIYKGESGDLECSYWVLQENENKARNHFKQAHKVLEALEHWFGPYPFYEDGYKLVEVPYPGMEHQSSVTYGNGYKNGYNGRDQSSTGWGKKFDFIIIHESGHEWFANSITNFDEADMWIHESFTAYSESLFVEYFWGKKAGAEYCRGTRLHISNDRPISGKYGVNYPGSGDMYFKGANMLHTLRQLVDDDEKWRGILREMNRVFYHQTVKAEQIEEFLAHRTGMDLKPFFDQYLRDTRIPTLEYILVNGHIRYRWINCNKNFNMKVRMIVNGEPIWLQPLTRWKNHAPEKSVNKIEPDPDFYISAMKLEI